MDHRRPSKQTADIGTNELTPGAKEGYSRSTIDSDHIHCPFTHHMVALGPTTIGSTIGRRHIHRRRYRVLLTSAATGLLHCNPCARRPIHRRSAGSARAASPEISIFHPDVLFPSVTVHAVGGERAEDSMGARYKGRSSDGSASEIPAGSGIKRARLSSSSVLFVL